jgi:hypothetical protein
MGRLIRRASPGCISTLLAVLSGEYAKSGNQEIGRLRACLVCPPEVSC